MAKRLNDEASSGARASAPAPGGASPYDSTPRRRPRRLRLGAAVNWVLAAVVIGCLSVASGWWLSDLIAEAAYANLASEAYAMASSDGSVEGDGGEAASSGTAGEAAAEDGGDGAGSSAIDFDSLLATNDHTVAWMKVANTPIDYAVVKAWASDPEYWLHHDFWWNASWKGVPFIDWRADADGDAILVYAHHLGDTGMMFSSIYGAWQQDWFDRIGNMEWTTPGKGKTTLQPLFAQVVDQRDQRPQTFDFEDREAFRDWLVGFGDTASATAPDWREKAEHATRAICCVTCARSYTGLPDRTVLVFCD